MPPKALLATLLVAALWASGQAVGGPPVPGDPVQPGNDVERIYVIRSGNDLYWTQFVTTPEFMPTVRYVLYGILYGDEGPELTRIGEYPYGTTSAKVPVGHDDYAMQVEWSTGSSPLYAPCLMIYTQPPNVSNECVGMPPVPVRRAIHYDLP